MLPTSVTSTFMSPVTGKLLCVFPLRCSVTLRHVPACRRSLNVDMEWLYGASESSNMEVDIGYLPQLELQSVGPSTPSVIVDEEGNVIDSQDGSSEPIQFVFEEIHWTSEMSQEEAFHCMEVTFYPFKKVGIHERG
ncbi:hypothetical protein XENOCAPTIV_023813 [Xenoophorus captivus]|uniref:Uncharacterized protein n=1 Tax=Xenoophorus captivus TaxID=1517983 RepID=A0ABV0Q602_9TELE